jgi:hypothetical protein
MGNLRLRAQNVYDELGAFYHTIKKEVIEGYQDRVKGPEQLQRVPTHQRKNNVRIKNKSL